MKVTVGKKTKETKPFPKYMKHHQSFEVLMTEDGRGIVTKGVNSYLLGYESNVWDMGCFTDVESPEVAQSIKPFPKTMISKSGCIVFFERPTAGMCLKQGGETIKSGTFLRDWHMEAFTDCNFPVTLENN